MLFSSKDIADAKQQPDTLQPGAIIDDAPVRTIEFKHGDVLANTLGPILQHESIEYMNAGCWSAHEMILYLLSITGPAKVYVTTWTMTESPARLLLEAMNTGLITELFCVMNVRMERSPAVMQLAKFNATKMRLSKNHSKVIVVENDTWGIKISGSQNITDNPNIESGVISTNKALASFHRNWIMHEIETGYKVE